MSASTAHLDELATHMATKITHFGLVDHTGTELTGGSYARVANTPTASGAQVGPSSDLIFNVPASADVSGWRGYSAASSGTDYGGSDLTREDYAGAGTYTLLSASTFFDYAAA